MPAAPAAPAGRRSGRGAGRACSAAAAHRGACVHVPGRARGVLPAPRRRRRRRALRRPAAARDQRLHVAGAHERRALAEHLAQRRRLAGDDRRAAGQRLDRRQAEALVLGGQHERVRAAVDRRELLVGDLAGEDHVGQLVRPRARRADEHERQLARRGGELGDVLAGIGVLQAADPHQVALGQREARAHRGDLLGAARIHRRRRPPRGSRRPARARAAGARPRRRRPPRVGTITRVARCTASWRRRRRRPVRRCSLRRLSAARSWSVTTIGHGLCSIAPSIHGEWNTSALRARSA